jgi:hypothetical protein
VAPYFDTAMVGPDCFAERDVFIIGSPRSGTTWLHAALSNHPSFASPPETHLFTDLALAGNAMTSRPTSIGPGSVLADGVFEQCCGSLWSHIRTNLLAACPGATRVLEKTPPHAEQMDFIRASVPDPLFIHIVRNPVDAVRSIMEASGSWGANWAPGSVENACSLWTRTVEAALTSARPNDTLLVHYERLQQGDDEWNRVKEFLGIDLGWELPDLTAAPSSIAKKVQYHRSTNSYGPVKRKAPPGHSFHDRDPTSQRTLSAFERRYTEWACRDLMSTLGYAPTRGRLGPLDRLRVQEQRFRQGLRAVRRRLRR